MRALPQPAGGGATRSPRRYVLVALLIGLAVGLAVGLARPTPDAAEAAGTTRVTWRCMASIQTSMYVVLHNASDKKVPVTVYSYSARRRRPHRQDAGRGESAANRQLRPPRRGGGDRGPGAADGLRGRLLLQHPRTAGV